MGSLAVVCWQEALVVAKHTPRIALVLRTQRLQRLRQAALRTILNQSPALVLRRGWQKIKRNHWRTSLPKGARCGQAALASSDGRSHDTQTRSFSATVRQTLVSSDRTKLTLTPGSLEGRSRTTPSMQMCAFMSNSFCDVSVNRAGGLSHQVSKRVGFLWLTTLVWPRFIRLWTSPAPSRPSGRCRSVNLLSVLEETILL